MSALRLVFVCAALLVARGADAQATYRWIDKVSGQPVFSDQAPPVGAKQVVKTNAEEHRDEQPLPYATQQAALKFPLTLYTAANCIDPCKQARGLLNGRGIPFTEIAVDSDEKQAELAKDLGGDATVPSLFVGRQRLIGLEIGAWNDLLDLAGYPKSAPYGAKPRGTLAH